MASVVGVSTGVLTTPEFPDAFNWPKTVDVALPGGTSVDDLIVAGYWLAATSDARFTGVEPALVPLVSYGSATDLSDITFDSQNPTPGFAQPGMLLIAALTDVAGFSVSSILAGYQSVGVSSPPLDDFLTAVPGSMALAIVWGRSETVSGDAAIGDAAGWATEASMSELPVESGPSYTYTAKCFSYLGPGPVPDLECTYGSDTYTRLYRVVTLRAAAAGTRPYLRQRQSPRANPRVSLNRTSLRQRQFTP